MPDQHSDTILSRLMALHPKIIDLNLDRMAYILEKLNHPERHLPPVVHVAGTNGKGSLIATLRSILEAAGYSVHVYTSPHLVRFAERIVLNGDIIPEPELTDLLLKCEEANGTDPITYFEITTAAAFKAFAENPADILLLETGLGGRLDATNMVDKPALTAITPVSHDHEQFLGSDLAGIAREKAGIMKNGVPVVIGPQDALVKDTLQEQAAKVGAPVVAHEDGWSFEIRADHWIYKGGDLSGVWPNPALKGAHQVANAATALACLEQLKDFHISPNAVKTGLETIVWPARLQPLTKGVLPGQVPDGVEIWLDGGHNEAAGARIAESFKEWNGAEPVPVYLISGMLNTKDQISFFRKLQPIVEKAVAVPIDGETAATPVAELATLGQAAGLDMTTAPSVEEAVDILIPHLAKRPCRLLICGSLYLAGRILRENS
ncbi:bifunctional folylpolyglutamate synthase/dihydrofolate synthase [Sneathiella aquimaris]|uniref:bifunctional folylpolyglutamate synthase/dihydrofolate synthase n=1 Tax=Sneathiella aquimaris TaxID=2599305 RepID=UPI00146A33BF|nr:folylpolyglutamate synthase/dihydrofolate synthase family protein [Sneathiella aquimaris]